MHEMEHNLQLRLQKQIYFIGQKLWRETQTLRRQWTVMKMYYADVSRMAVQIIECDDHAHFASKAGSVISSKSPSPAFRWSGIYYTEP